VPEKEGSWFLGAVVRRKGDTPVISQRVVRAIDPAVTGKGLGKGEVCLLGAPAAADKWLKRWNIPVVPAGRGKLAGDVAVIWDPARLTKATRPTLADRQWDWPELLDVEFARARSSRAFAYARARTHPALKGLANTDFLQRFNAIPGTAAEFRITGPAVQAATSTRLLWVNDPAKAVLVRFAVGKGEILLTTLALRTRITPANATYDPAAERLLLNLIARGGREGERR